MLACLRINRLKLGNNLNELGKKDRNNNGEIIQIL